MLGVLFVFFFYHILKQKYLLCTILQTMGSCVHVSGILMAKSAHNVHFCETVLILILVIKIVSRD